MLSLKTQLVLRCAWLALRIPVLQVHKNVQAQTKKNCSLNIFYYVLFFQIGIVHTRAVHVHVWKYKLYLAVKNSSGMYDCVLPPNQHFVSLDKISTTEKDYKLLMQQGSCDLRVIPFWAAFPLIPSEHTHITQSKCISVVIEREILCS